MSYSRHCPIYNLLDCEVHDKPEIVGFQTFSFNPEGTQVAGVWSYSYAPDSTLSAGWSAAPSVSTAPSPPLISGSNSLPGSEEEQFFVNPGDTLQTFLERLSLSSHLGLFQVKIDTPRSTKHSTLRSANEVLWTLKFPNSVKFSSCRHSLLLLTLIQTARAELWFCYVCSATTCESLLTLRDLIWMISSPVFGKTACSSRLHWRIWVKDLSSFL